jgi:predicted nucleotidyltransferase
MVSDALIQGALRFCRKKANGRASGLNECLRAGENWAHSAFRYGLAKQISRYLLRSRCGVKSVYLYGSTMEDRAGSASDIDLLLVVRKKNARLMRRLKKLKPEILRAYKKLIGNGTAGLKDMLDINIVDETESRLKKGYASVIGSLYTPAVRVS